MSRDFLCMPSPTIPPSSPCCSASTSQSHFIFPPFCFRVFASIAFRCIVFVSRVTTFKRPQHQRCGWFGAGIRTEEQHNAQEGGQWSVCCWVTRVFVFVFRCGFVLFVFRATFITVFDFIPCCAAHAERQLHRQYRGRLFALAHLPSCA